MNPNTTKARLRAGEAVFGCFVRYPEAGLVELIGYEGWDFVVFDGEHGVIEPRDCEQMVRAAERRGVTPITRVTTNAPPVILRYLDTGAQWRERGARYIAVGMEALLMPAARAYLQAARAG